MDQDLLKALSVLSQGDEHLDAVIDQLMAAFPGVANAFAWKDRILTEQRKYQTGPRDTNDCRLEVALRWLRMANQGRLSATMDARHGLSVTEIDDEALAHDDLKLVLFKMLRDLNGLNGLMFHDIYAAVDHYLGLSLTQHVSVFEDVVTELCDKRYLRYKELPNGQIRINKGINFDEWKDIMTKSDTTSVTTHTYNFHDQVGAVQTGSGSVANVQQAASSDPYAALRDALQSLSQELSSSELAPSNRQEAEELIEKTVQEIESEKPTMSVVKALCSSLATAVQTLGSTSAAYQAVVGALAAFGISFV